MILRRLAILLILVSFCSIPISAQGSSRDLVMKASNESETFRQVLLDLMLNIENATGVGVKASSAILEASDETIEALYNFLPDKELFITSVKRITAGVEPVKFPSSSETLAPRPLGSPEVTLFEPDYPPDEGVYLYVVLGPLRVLNLTQNPWDRCKDSFLIDDYGTVIFALIEAAELADAACNVAGCDPTGVIFCLEVCGVAELAKLALWVAKKPMDLCEYHDKRVDSAEVEAAYENGVTMLYNLDDHDDKLDLLEKKIDEQKGVLETVLANQEKIIELLNTPQGQRPDWNKKNQKK